MSKQNKKLEFGDIEYLAFEGGGAMGGAYLGALAAMQDIDIKNGNRLYPGLLQATEDGRTPDTKISEGCVEGISGSSIGAIFGMCVAMGYTAEQINARLITDKVMTLLHEERFTDEKKK